MGKQFAPITWKFPHMLHGGDYNPEQWADDPDIVEKDIALMKKAHINNVSLGIFSWAQLEPQKDQFNFSWLDEIIDKLYQQVESEYQEKISILPPEVTDEFEKAIMLRVIDTHWMEHINTLSHLREAVMMRGYGGQDPLRAYTIEGLDMYENMLMNIDKDVTLFLLKAEVKQKPIIIRDMAYYYGEAEEEVFKKNGDRPIKPSDKMFEELHEQSMDLTRAAGAEIPDVVRLLGFFIPIFHSANLVDANG